jgi:hypothetical protein
MDWINVKKEMPKHYKLILVLDGCMIYLAQRSVNT